jgi:hypothetical protein
MSKAKAAMDNSRRSTYALPPRFGAIIFGVIVTALSALIGIVGLPVL